jgi:arsenite methyltransferase
MIEFDADVAALLDRAYRGRDAVRRRHANLAALDPAEGEAVLDIGCGTGILLRELFGCVGPSGTAHGIDPSEDMLSAARTACDGVKNVSIRRADAYNLPFEDDSFDAVVSVQVFEYLDDLPRALTQCRRVLKPGGRLVIGDWHWDSLVWQSGDPDRMDRVLEAWDAHFADGAVPAKLPGLLPEAGFGLRGAIPVTFCDTTRREDGFARMMQSVIAPFVMSQGTLPVAEVRAWSDDLDLRAAEGRAFFCFTHIVTVAEAV